MKQSIAYIITTTSITAVIAGKVYTLTSGHANFNLAKQALSATPQNEARILALMNVSTAINAYSDGRVSVKDGVVYYRNAPMHDYCAQKILAFMEQGMDYKRLMRFFDNLMNNPSARAVNELYKFLEHKSMPLTDDGCFLAYKGVRTDYYSITAGDKNKVVKGKSDSSGRIFNGVGEVIEVVRNYVNDDATVGCSSGLHAGSHSYAANFGRGGRMMIVKINPADVVSVPTDCSCQKLRTAKYEVVDEVKHDFVMPSEFSDDEDEGFAVTKVAAPSYESKLREKANGQKRDSSGRFV